MRVVMIGSGYVGLVSGACFSEFGHQVTCVDNDDKKVASLRQGEIPIFEPGLAAMVGANVAAGRLDGYWESDLNSWDLAAGALIVREAGGLVTDYNGDGHFLENGQIVVGNSRIIADMLRIIQQQLNL